MLVYDPQL